jgi:hypothetical protein
MRACSEAWIVALALGAGLLGCGKGSSPTGESSGSASTLGVSVEAGPVTSSPTVRLYFLSDLAGALAPCGCIKDQLGGMDHLGAWMASERARAPAALLAAAGPLFFMDDKLRGDRADQDERKAATVASILDGLNLVAFAPGMNDWDVGDKGLVNLARTSGSAAIVADSAEERPAPFARAIVKDIGGIKVGFVGFGQVPRAPGASDASASSDTNAASDARAASKVSAGDPEDIVARGVDLARQGGANVLVALAAVGRDEARRIARAVPELTAIVVGSPSANGEENARVPQGEQVGRVILVQGANHLQSVAVLDLYVRDPGSPGHLIRFADATGLDRAPEREKLAARIDDLHEKVAIWERDRSLPPADIESRKRDLAALEQESASLDVETPPARGSFFRYSLKEVRSWLGTDLSIQTEIGAYDAEVNSRNRSALSDRKPLPNRAGLGGYVGLSVCGHCHAPAVAVWNHTWHAHAYGTLRSEGREFDLECVGCHVTGYERPGGSNATHVDKLQSVQCEVCHGPGSKHVADPIDEGAILAKPDAARCLDCHHSPHVEQFDPVAKMKEILGPGHGMPLHKP